MTKLVNFRQEFADRAFCARLFHFQTLLFLSTYSFKLHLAAAMIIGGTKIERFVFVEGD
jgi:hypothetical protein